MPDRIDTQHREYAANLPRWHRCRNVCLGEDAVKAAGVEYLPRIGITAQEYDAYRDRAMFFNATERTLQALVGAIMQKEPHVEVDTLYEELVDDVDRAGTPLPEFARKVVEEVLQVGRIGLLTDRGTGVGSENSAIDRPFIAAYTAESIINWRVLDGTLVLVVLKEEYEEPSSANAYSLECRTQYRELLLQDGQYTQRVWRSAETKDEFTVVDEIIPTFRGKAIGFIPFVFVTPMDLSVNVDKPPIIDLVNVNVAHYRNSADLEHGRHFTALPTPWVSGFRQAYDRNGDMVNTGVLQIGSTTAWTLEDPNARCGFLEFTGAGLKALSDGMAEKERLMAVLGSRLLSDGRKGVEAADALRIRAGGESMSLASIAYAVSAALTKAVSWMVWWECGVLGKASVELNREFVAERIDPQTLTALVQAWQAGAIDQGTLLFNLKRGEILAPDTGIDEVKDLLDLEGSDLEGSRVDTSDGGAGDMDIEGNLREGEGYGRGDGVLTGA